MAPATALPPATTLTAWSVPPVTVTTTGLPGVPFVLSPAGASWLVSGGPEGDAAGVIGSPAVRQALSRGSPLPQPARVAPAATPAAPARALRRLIIIPPVAGP